jgi:hypothetical protein
MWSSVRFSRRMGCTPMADVIASATAAPEPAAHVANTPHRRPPASAEMSTNPQALRSAALIHCCHPTIARAAAEAGKYKCTTSVSPVGNVVNVIDVVTPKLPPPPPRNPQNRSG